MKNETTQVLGADAQGLGIAADLLRDGGLVAFPTETVYGLGADSLDDVAVARIYEAKGRPSFNPLIAHVASIEMAKRFVVFDDVAERLAAAFWPGALTLVLPLRDGAAVSKLVTAGLPTLAVRMPDHLVASALLAAFDGPISAPSANPSGRVSPTSAAHVLAGLEGRIDAVIDGGPCSVGLESTIVGCGAQPALLRAGGIPVEAIEAALGGPMLRSEDPDVPLAPGQLASHYAPVGSVRLNAVEVEDRETLLGFGPVEADLNLSKAGDLTEAAANLFEMLHKLDAMGAARIAVSPIPDHGLGAAINDRLRRAAAPRE